MAENTKTLERCPTGIKGLDELVSGGFPRGRSVLISGSCGTGKTILSLQFLHHGIVKFNEPAVLVELEQNPVNLKNDMLSLGFDFQKLENEKKLVIIDASLSRIGTKDMKVKTPVVPDSSFSLLPGEVNFQGIVDLVIKVADKIGAKRVVVDSLPALDNILQKENEVRDAILYINYRLQQAGLTSILISDIIEKGRVSKHGVEEYVVDGVITLHYSAAGPDAGRTLTIEKMRGTPHSENIHSIKFKEGVGIYVAD
ncbi:MAG: ATPase domain-containing protein [Candidatus Altiarchaeota archaeon]